MISMITEETIGEGVKVLKSIRSNKSVSAEALEAIRHYIVDSGLQPGDSLPTEAEIAGMLNCGKSSVREALKSLEAVGIVKILHGKRAVINMFSFSSIFDNLPQRMVMDREKLVELLEVRKAIELFFIDKVVENVTSTAIARLKREVTRMRNRTVEVSEHIKIDREFHASLLSFSGNKTASDFVRIYWNFQYGHIEPVLDKERIGKIVEDHTNILTAIESKNLEGAKFHLKKHFDDIKARLY